MAKKRKFAAYRRVERPYTRFSKYKKQCYVRARPASRIVKYNFGSLNKDFEYRVDLVSKSALQIRDLALEAARITSNRVLEEIAGKQNYKMMIIPYPHHVLRENAFASGAGADRMSTGMQKAFGKVVGVAAQIKAGQTLMSVHVNKDHLELAKEAARRASHKFPCQCLTVVNKNAAKPAAKKASA